MRALEKARSLDALVAQHLSLAGMDRIDVPAFRADRLERRSRDAACPCPGRWLAREPPGAEPSDLFHTTAMSRSLLADEGDV